MVVPAIRIERIYSALQADVSTTITTRAHLERPVGNRTHRPHVGNVVLCH